MKNVLTIAISLIWSIFTVVDSIAKQPHRDAFSILTIKTVITTIVVWKIKDHIRKL